MAEGTRTAHLALWNCEGMWVCPGKELGSPGEIAESINKHTVSASKS